MPVTVTAINPNVALVGGDVAVTITGTLFQNGATVRIGGAPATEVRFVSATQLTCKVPAHARGERVDVVVTNPDATSGTGANLFHYCAKVTAISPSTAPTAGGTNVTITGEGFVAGMTVQVGGVALVGTNIASGTQITGQTPAHAPTRGTVRVTNAAGGMGGILRDGFEWSAPMVTTLEPPRGPAAGGTDVTIRGDFFGAGVAVNFDATASPAVNRVSQTEITARTPAHAEGKVNVTVTQPDGHNTTFNRCFEFLGARVTGVDPNKGPAAGGTDITITGERFAGGATVQVCGIAATHVVVVDATTITARTAACAAGKGDVVVTNLGEAAKTLEGAFTVGAAAAITAVSPVRGGTTGGTAITITGQRFGEGATVRVGGNPATDVTVVSDTTITATTAAHAAGAVDVEVVNDGGATATAAGAFTYSNITAIEPRRGLPAGGETIVIRGEGFADNPTVRFGDDDGTGVDRRSATEIGVDTPAHAAGTVDVTVEGGEAPITFANGFTFSPVTSVEPERGPVGGGTVVTLRGDGFTAETTVAFGATAAAARQLISGQELRATTPAVVAGPVDIVVRRDAHEVRVAQGYTFRAAATVTGVEPAAGPLNGGTNITITGTGFLAGATVNIGIVAATDVVVVSDTTITATTPLGPPPPMGGVRPASDVIVTNPAEPAVTGAGLYTYRDPPTITAVAPAEGPVAGGREVTITGTNFVDGVKIRIDGAELTDLTYVGATTVRGRVPAHVAGACAMRAQNPDEAAGPARAAAFTYRVAPTPTGHNEVRFIMDGEEYFNYLRLMFEEVRQAPPDPLTYVRLAFWMIEKDTTLGSRNHFKKTAHLLLTYIEQTIRAGHDVDIILWRAAYYQQWGLGQQTAAVNEAFAQAVYELDQSVMGAPGVGRARVFLEHYEGPVGASNHQKIAIISLAGQRMALVGGINLSTHYFAYADHGDNLPGRIWHDTAVFLRGPVTDEIEAEWMRRWKHTNVVADNWLANSVGGVGGIVLARQFGFWSSTTVRKQAVAIQENTTLQNHHPDNRSITIALTRAEGDTRYTHLLDKIRERIAAANNYIYFENYHFTDPDLVRAIYQRFEQRRLAGHTLRVVIVVPQCGGGSGYLTRRAWLQMILRFADPAGNPYCTRVHYLDDADAAQNVVRANCVHWDVQDPYDPTNSPPSLDSWLDDALVFCTNAIGATNVTVPFDKITSVEGGFHFYASLDRNNLPKNVYTHSKIAVFDGQYIACGTSNWSVRSMQYDGEISAIIDDAAIAGPALTRLLAHYNTSVAPAPAITPANIEAEATRNLAAMVAPADPANAARAGQLRRFALVPLCHHAVPRLAFPRAKPSGIEAAMAGGPNYTWI